MSRITASLTQLCALGLWLGAAAFFSAAVAPAVFAVLPTRTLAGAVVGRLLPAVFYSGMLIGVVIIALELAARGSWNFRGRETAAAVMVAACAFAQLVIAPRIERIRLQIGGPLEGLSVDDVRRIEFGRLHGLSVAWLGLAMLAGAVAAIASIRTLHSTR